MTKREEIKDRKAKIDKHHPSHGAHRHVAIAGIPNCGKTTFFNAVTGATHKVGNWHGVTVEKIEGHFVDQGRHIHLIDLPGTYNLTPDTEDQKIAGKFIEDGEFDVILNVVDASNLSRNLFLTMDILKRTKNVIVLLNMVDVAEQEGIKIDIDKLSTELGVQVIPVVAVDKKSIKKAKAELSKALKGTFDSIDGGISVEDKSTDTEKYDVIDGIISDVSVKTTEKVSFTDKVDKILLNKFLAVPIFLFSMFLTFFFSINVGGIFIDFFDIVAGYLFVDVPATFLGFLSSPEWLITIFTSLGAGLQTVATFVPVVFFMFVGLAILEDIGYMSRAAVVADRFMRKIGLPGNAFIPMIVGFGCTVPAIMATRTLKNKRDKYMTIFMAPFMSCGARLPVYAIFCAALYGNSSSLIVFSIYLVGIAIAILTGLLLKTTMFKGKRTEFIVDLPMYHVPRAKSILKSVNTRTWYFIKRAGTVMVIAVAILGFLNSIGINDGKVSFGNEDQESSILAIAGKAVTPIFTPMGIDQDNWPATVSIFTGLFAKEAIVGTINSLYATMGEEVELESLNEDEEADAEEEGLASPFAILEESLLTVWDGFIGLFGSADILGVSDAVAAGADPEAFAEDAELDTAVYRNVRNHFTPVQAYAFILFVLMYFPCLAVIAAAKQEMGNIFTVIMTVYCTILGWAIATLFYQVAEGHSALFIVLSIAILVAIYGALFALSKVRKLKV